ncbi:MAG TPA: LamG domain-containing protein [Bradyrhizobium sp.]|nr:LamG domain-containing protein [Bradyrhizobium sp.]
MSTTLFFLVPIGMLAIVWSLCFVGCFLQTSGLEAPYSNNILAEPSLVAYWPLSDFPNSPPPAGAPALPPPPQGSTSVGTAQDLSGNNHNGNYINPPIYLSGTTFLTTMGNPPVDLNPTLNLHQASIVPGDAFASGSKNLPACVDFEGGYVSIPWAANSPPLTDFTLEAWVAPRWTVTGFNWGVFSARTNNGTGFAIGINAQNQWELATGDGTAVVAVNTMVPAAVNGALTYVAVTFTSTTQVLSLWINPGTETDSNSPPPPTAAWPPSPATTTPYVAIDPTQPVTFFIGTGDNQDAQTPRTQNGGPGAPLVPFQGLIQSVALYNTALDPTDLASHFQNGAG